MSSILTDNIDDTNKPYRVLLFQSNKPILFSFGHQSSTIAQLVERVTVNHDVAGSNPVGGVALVQVQTMHIKFHLPLVVR